MITKIEDFLNSGNKFFFPDVPTGSANSVEEFFNNCIELVLPKKKESILSWHKLLTQYADDKDSILLSRLYESRKIKGEWDTRRGMYTKMADDFQYAYASNFFARLIYTMAYYDFVPSYEDFKQMFTNKKISLFSFIGTTAVEKKLAAFTTKAYPARFYTQNWYLAHIVAVNDEDYYGYNHLNIQNIFTPGNQNDWKMTNSGYTERIMTNTLSAEEKKVARAHFLRFVDPLNYFLVPNTKHITIKTIGEDINIIAYMKRRAYEIYGKEYEDFLNKVLSNPNLIPTKDTDALGKIPLSSVVYSNIDLSSIVTKVVTPKQNLTYIQDKKPQVNVNFSISYTDDIFEEINSYTMEPFDKSFSETDLEYENEYIKVICFTHSNKWLGKPHISEMGKTWNIIFVQKKDFASLQNWKNLQSKYDIFLTKVTKGKHMGCIGIRLRGMKQKPTSSTIEHILNYIFK